MRKFLEWWYTSDNGEPYMTFPHCVQDMWLVVLIAFLLINITIIYLMIARDDYKKAKRYPKSAVRSYLLEKNVVFIFCALSGYLFRFVSIWVAPYKLLALLLVILLIWSWKFYLTSKKTNVIERILDSEDFYLQKYQQLKSKLKDDKNE